MEEREISASPASLPMSSPVSLPPSRVQTVLSFFEQQAKTVLTFVGYSGAGYEHPDRVRKCVVRVLAHYNPLTTIVNVGVTSDGIGRAYRWAKKRGFVTAGIVSTAVLKLGAPISRDCDHPFAVKDSSFGGYVHGRLSPVSRAMVVVSDEMIAIGGGEVARDELIEMKKRSKPIRFIRAEMNHARAMANCHAKGLPAPTSADLKGNAYTRFGRA
jgi:hypothetical protein